MKKPNFLIVQADQMTALALSAYGNTVTKTPNLQRLADEGVVFTNAYCNFPLCAPSRASTLSGKLASSIGVWDNAAEFSCAIPTIAHYLRELDYYTILCGKMHFIGPDQIHGFNKRLVTDIYPSSFAWTSDWEAGQHYRPTGINLKAVINSGVCTRSLQLDYDEEVAHAAQQSIYDLVRFQENSPFMLWVSFTQPHSPYLTTKKYWDLYNENAINAPTVPPIPVEQLDQMSQWLHYGHGGDLDTVEDKHVLTARRAYYGMCSYIDDKVGQLVATLEECDKLEDTVILFISDHGEMLGERGKWFKQYFYEYSARVPMILRWPKLFQPSKVDELVSLLDLVPTVLSLAGGENGQDFEGKDLTPLIQDESIDWDNKVISEYTGEGVLAPCRMLRRDNFKLIYTHGHPPILYDLQNDPNELRDLAQEKAYQTILQELLQELLQDWDAEEINQRCLASQRDRLFIHRVTQGEPNWAHLHRVDDGQRYVRNASAIEVKAKARYPKLTS